MSDGYVAATAPWLAYPEGDPRATPGNWNGTGQYTGAYIDGWMPPQGYGQADYTYSEAPAQPAYNITGGGDYTGQPAPPTYNFDAAEPYTAPGAPAQPAYDPLSSAYPVSQPTYGTPGTGSNMANPYDPSQADAGYRAAYDQLLGGTGELLGGAPATAPPVAPATDPYAAPAADPYAAPVAATDPYTGLPVYEPAYSVSEPYSAPGGYDAGVGGGYGGGEPSFGATYPYPSFGQSAMNPGRQQPVIPGQFDPFAWSGNPNPMPAPNETRQMILGAMQLGAEIEQQRSQQPVMNATSYTLHRLGLTKPEEPTPQLPVTPPPRSRFGV